MKTKRTASVSSAKRALRSAADPAKAKLLQGFFKTGPGEYAAGDRFLGVMVPQTRVVAAAHADLPLTALLLLLDSPFHEERLLALIIMAAQFKRAGVQEQRRIFNAYLASTAHINNWDLVDISAPKIVGAYLETRPRTVLYKLAASKLIWERRIAVLATFWFIRNDDFKDVLKICKLLLSDEHELIHKAVGWALREVGKRNVTTLESFLERYGMRMSRTTLRYAIERFSPRARRKWLKMPHEGPARPQRIACIVKPRTALC